MKKLFSFIIILSLFSTPFLTTVFASSTNGTIDPSNGGFFKAALLNDPGIGADKTINFGKFTSTPASNISINTNQIFGYAWGASTGWIVMNCFNTTSGCSGTNGNFKVSVANDGVLSGYAWGENTGWINFGPFTNTAISQVRIDSTGTFTGTLGVAGYAWSQNMGYIVFDCSNSATCSKTDYIPTVAFGVTVTPPSGGGGGGGHPAPAHAPTPAPVVPTPTPVTPVPTPTPVSTPTSSSTPTKTPKPNPVVIPAPAPIVPVIPIVTPTPEPVTPPSVAVAIAPPSAKMGGSASGGGVVGSTQTFNPLQGVQNFISNNVPDVKKATTVVTTAVKTKSGRVIVGTVATTAAAITTTVSLLTTLLVNPLSGPNIALIPFRLWSLMLGALGIRKRYKKWGVVYDSETKQPIDPAYVTAYDMNGVEVASAITDMDGRYGFLLSPGTYRVVAQKTNYEFPSKKLSGKVEDELYSDLYFGQEFTVTENDTVIIKNIPLDPVGFDWNESVKASRGLTSYFAKNEILISKITWAMFVLGFLFSIVSVFVIATTYNIIIFVLYMILAIMRSTGAIGIKTSIVLDQEGQVVPFALIQVYNPTIGNQRVSRKVATVNGKFYILVPKGTYYMTVSTKNPAPAIGYTVVYTSENFETKNGQIIREIVIKTK